MTEHEARHAPASVGMRFGTRLILILMLVVLGTVAALAAAVQFALQRAVDRQLERELVFGERVWNETHLTRLQQLMDRTSVLAEDFGFKEALSTADAPTVQSALSNAGNRIGAPGQIALDANGDLLVANLEGIDTGGASVTRLVEALRNETSQQGFSVGVAGMDGQAHAVAMVPVFAPDLIAWVAMLQPVNQRALDTFQDLAGVDAAILGSVDCTPWLHTEALSDWSLGAQDCPRLRDAPDTLSTLSFGGDSDRPSKLLKLSLPGSDPVWMALAASRDAAWEPYQGLRNTLIEISLLAALLAAVVAWRAGRRVTRPLSDIADAAARIVRGDYGTELRVRGRDELAELSRAFNQMQRGIEMREQQIVYQAGHDALTGLPNRERALLELDRRLAASGGRAGVVALIDIRHLRQINDLFGHAFGDRLLNTVADRLDDAVRTGDLVSRWSGDEFLVLLDGVDADVSAQRAARLHAELCAPLEIDGTPFRIEATMGIAPFPEDAIDGASMARRADIALNEAKELDESIRCYAPGHDEQRLRQLRLIGELRMAIERDEFELVYQPKVDLATKQVRHAEVLLRWHHRELGRIPPDEFIPLAERAGLIRPITAFVLDRAAAQCAAWRQQGLSCGVAVNLSALDLADGQIVDAVLDALKRHRVPPADLILEVTESAMMRDLENALDAMHRLRRSGLHFSIDDFGTGQSSLAQLKRLPVDELKIDKSFVMNLLPGTEDERIVHSIVELAHALRLRVVAEGVETDEGRSLLESLGCETAQGYFYSRPLSATDFSRWMDARAASIGSAAADGCMAQPL